MPGWKRVGVFIRLSGVFLSALFCFGYSSVASASPLSVGNVCEASAWTGSGESAEPSCENVFSSSRTPAHVEDALAEWGFFDSPAFVRLITPFSWNFASAFDTLPGSLRDEIAPAVTQKSGQSLRVRGEDAYCEAGCSTTLSSVPEPATMVLLGSALFLIGSLARSRVDVG